MARKTAFTFWDSPPKAAMTCYEGTWSDDDDYKLGGYFASPLDADTWVALKTDSDFTVMKATASTNIVIGKLESEPQGEHTTSGRQGNVQLFGDYILEVEIDTASDTVVVGQRLAFSKSGGSYSEGVWLVNTASVAGPIALASTSATGSIASGSVVPALFGFRAYATSS